MITSFVRLLVYLLRKISFSKLHITSSIFANLLRLYRQSTITKNLKNSFPLKSIAEIQALRNNYIKHLSIIICESLKGFSIEQSDLAKRFVFNNPKVANKYYDQKRSIILVLGHIGNWEWGQAIVSHYLKFKCIGVYKSLTNQSFDKYLLKKRSQYDVKLLTQKEILKYIIANPDELNVYIFIADQYPPSEPRLLVDFLNQKTYFDSSVEKIAKKYNLPVIYADIKSSSKPHSYMTDLIEISASPVQSPVGEITKSYARLLEININRQPELWLWSHKRWK